MIVYYRSQSDNKVWMHNLSWSLTTTPKVSTRCGCMVVYYSSDTLGASQGVNRVCVHDLSWSFTTAPKVLTGYVCMINHDRLLQLSRCQQGMDAWSAMIIDYQEVNKVWMHGQSWSLTTTSKKSTDYVCMICRGRLLPLPRSQQSVSARSVMTGFKIKGGGVLSRPLTVGMERILAFPSAYVTPWTELFSELNSCVHAGIRRLGSASAESVRQNWCIRPLWHHRQLPRLLHWQWSVHHLLSRSSLTEGRISLMSLSCLESRGCRPILLSCLLSCSSANNPFALTVCPFSTCGLFSTFFEETFQTLYIRTKTGFFVWLFLSSSLLPCNTGICQYEFMLLFTVAVHSFS